ncbi:MAG: DUF4349 domain-containing protein [Candidatus Uhrbacteria bacterium]
MTKKTKIILASVIGAVVLIPVVLFIAILIWLSIDQSSTTSSGSVGSYDTYSMKETRNSYPTTPKMMASETSYDTSFSEGEVAFNEQVTAGSTAAEVDQKIIKTGYLDITVDAVDETVAKIVALATGKGGYTQDSSVSEREDGTKFGNITIRIPASEFENTLVEVKKFAVTVDTESANGQDVTEEYTDLESQLRNAQAQEAEYLNILKKAVTVDDILNVQSYLGQVRGEIESLQGRIKYLENQTGYSTISVSLSEESNLKIPSKEFRPWSSIKEAAQALVSVLQGLVITLIWLVILGGGVILPIILIIWLIVKLIKKVLKRRQNKK